MRWFARGKLWESREAERDDFQMQRHAASAPRKPQGDRPPAERRGSDWRPGGTHKDPRDRFRKRIVPSARGRKKIPRRSAIGTSPDMRRSRAATGATNRLVLTVAIGRGRTSLAVIGRGATDRLVTQSVRRRGNRPIDRVHRANANPGRTSRRTARRPLIGRGRQSPPGPARSESRGSASHRPIGRGATSPPATHQLVSAADGGTRPQAMASGHGAASRPTVRVRPANASRGATSRQAAPREATAPGAISRRAAHPAATAPGARSRPIDQGLREGIVRPMRVAVRPTVEPAEAGGPASRRRPAASAPGARSLPQAAGRREGIGPGAPSRAIRIASRSRRAVHARATGRLRRASGATTKISRADHGQPSRPDEAAVRSVSG